MANESFLRGLEPVSTNGQPVPTIAMPKKTTTDADLFIGSPVVVASGVVDTVGTANTDNMTGAVVGLKDANGVSVQNLNKTSTEGTVIMSYLPNQRYKAHVYGTTYVDTDAGNKYYTIKAESATVASGSNLGDPYSKRTLETEDGTNGVIVVGERVKKPMNAAATAYTEVYCTIKSSEYSPI